jgi:rRNA-processing protein EBP2
VYNRGGLVAAAEELKARGLPWVERLDVASAAKVAVADVHDDLSREVAFYEMALAAVKEGRERLKAVGVGWKRPEDFFCEMVKSDTHMARVKDRLIFEQHKLDAFEQRKERQTQGKFAKAKASKQAEDKAARKKENIEAVDKWRKDTKERRKGALGDDDDKELDRLMQAGDDEAKAKDGQSRKRKADDRKYGFGGVKNKKFNRNDDKSLNNTRSFNPKQMKANAREGGKGKGKGASGKGKGGGKGAGKGASRPGKDARSGGKGGKGR